MNPTYTSAAPLDCPNLRVQALFSGAQRQLDHLSELSGKTWTLENRQIGMNQMFRLLMNGLTPEGTWRSYRSVCTQMSFLYHTFLLIETNKTPTTVYAVGVGEYSDYRIKRVFADRAYAEHYCDLQDSSDGDNAMIEDWEVETEKLDGPVFWQVTISDTRPLTASLIEYDPTEGKVSRWDSAHYGTSYSAQVQARNREMAIKIGTDVIARYKAEEAGVAV